MTLSAKSFRTDKPSLRYSPLKRLSYARNERKLNFFKSYTKNHCDLESLSNFILTECDCVKFSMPRYKDTNICNLSKSFCYSDAISRWPYGDEKSKGQSVMPYDCFNPTEDIKYSVKLDRTSEYEAKERTAIRE